MATVILIHQKINRDSRRVSKIKPFINKYNWNGIKYPSKIDDWKTFEKKYPTIILNILYIKETYTLLIFENITHPMKNK